jgi:hypothetical protein
LGGALKENHMSVKIEFDTDNAAFAGDDMKPEIRWILGELAAQIANGKLRGTIRDSNGNAVGAWLVKLLPKAEG